MKMYIAGPISGLDPIWVDNNFKTAARELKILDIEPVNPNDMSGWGLSWEAYMSIAETIFKTGEIDGVLMLEGWEHSKGARLEHAWAVLDKIPIYYEKDGILEPARKLKKERAERPYDAMGDDQGRGDIADDWYRENFVERYDDGKVEEYKRRLVAWLQAWAEEEEMSTRGSYLKPAPLLRRIVEKIENGEI